MIQKYAEQFKKLEQFASINGQIESILIEPENLLRTAEMPQKDDYGIIGGSSTMATIGGTGEGPGRGAQSHAGQKSSIWERPEDAKLE